MVDDDRGPVLLSRQDLSVGLPEATRFLIS